MNALRKAINAIVTLAAFCLCLGSLPAEAALPNGSQDVYNIFTTGIGAKITGTDFDPYVKNNGAYASWSSSDFILTYDGGPVGTDSSGKGIMLEDDSYPPRGAFITYSSSSTGFDTRAHWMKVSANNTTLGSFQLTDLLVTGFGDTYQINVIGTKVGGGTVQTGWVSYYVTDWNTAPTTTITLTNFAGVQLTSYEIDILPVDNGAGGRPASFTFKSFTVSNAHIPVSPPTVASISPTSGSTAGGTSVTITGTDLSDANSVTIGGAAATGISVLGSTSITATTPAGTVGAKDVVVTTTYGGSGTGTGLFAYIAAPAVTTGAASAISATGATLNGTVNANGGSTAVTFEYGLTAGYGSSVAATPSPVGGASNTAVSASISGLACATTYHFRIKGTSGGGTAYGSDQTFASSVCPSYTVTYNGNGNTGGAAPTDAAGYLSGATVTVLGNTGALARTGYTFAGWNTASNGSGSSYSGGSTFAMGTGNVTLYAQWTANNYSVAYNANGASGGVAPTDATFYHIGNTVTVLGNTGSLVRTGYTFAGWNTASNGSGSSYSGGSTFAMGAGNATLYAQWTANNYSVTYNGNGSTGGAVPTDATSYHIADTATVLSNTGSLTRTGYTFGGWNTASNGSGTSYSGGDTFAIGSSNVILYAQWAANNYSVTYNGNTNTGGAVPTDGNTYHTADTVTVLGNSGGLAKTGYSFVGWNTAADGSGSSRSAGSTFAMGGSHVTLYAVWLGIPTATSAGAIALNGFTARWNSVAGATGYTLDVATDSGFTSLLAGYNNRDVGTATSQTLSGLASGTPYYYRVRAYSGAGSSASSNTIGVTTGTGLIVTNANDSGPGSLRQTIADANPGDTIGFAADVSGVITLTSGPLSIAKDLTIGGPGAAILTLSGNNATGIFQIPGASRFTLQNLTLANGVAVGGGALADNPAADITIDACIFNANSAQGGGAIVGSGSLTISDSTFTGNSANASFGGAIFASGGSVSISRSVFSGNNAPAGGAIANGSPSMNLVNVTLSGNSAASAGGALYSAAGATLNLANTTIAGNSTTGSGGGIAVDVSGTVNLKNSIVANNSAPTGPDIAGPVNSQDYNLLRTLSGATVGGTTAHNITAADPLLGALAHNGGPTQTLALLAGSPAIDSGTCAGAPATDQRGLTRPQNGLCDIGAHERGAPAALAASGGSPQTAAINAAFATPLGATLSDALGGKLDGVGIVFTGPGSGAGIAAGGSVGTNASGVASFSATANGIVGSYVVSATVGALSANFNLSNGKAPQSIAFANPGAQIFGSTPTLGATASSGLAPTFTSSTPGVCGITVGGTLTFLATGPCTIDADQGGDASYQPAGTVSQTFAVNAAVPGAPTMGAATPGDASASIAFTPPAFNGGAPIDLYRATCTGGIAAIGSASPISVAGLSNGTSTTCTVAAHNSAGWSGESAASGSFTPSPTPATPPAAPTAVLATPGNAQVTVAFTPSASPGTLAGGGAATIAGYSARCGAQANSGSASPIAVSGLANGTAVTCTVTATNSASLSATSAPSASVTPATVPGAPTMGTATPGNASASIAFAPPAFNGGAPIDLYRATCTGGIAATGSASPIGVAGLSNGTSTTCTVAAHNSLGWSGESAASNAFIPTPGAVTSYSAPSATGSGTVTASFSGGGSNCGYAVRRYIPLNAVAAPPPAGVVFPHGLFDFSTSGCTPGSTLNFTIAYPQALPAGTQYWKFGPTPGNGTPHWYVLPASIVGNQATFSIVDGGLGDDDLTANGNVVDQGGPGAGNGGSAAIPTLSEWGVIALSALMLLFGIRSMSIASTMARAERRGIAACRDR